VAFGELVARNRRRYGGYVVHAAVLLLAVGIAGSSAYQTVEDAKLRPGQSVGVAGYRLLYRGSVQRQAANHTEVRALVDVYRGGSFLGTVQPGKNSYPAEQQVSNEMAIRTDWLRGEDLDVISDDFQANGAVEFRILKKPLVNLIWLAGLVFVAGSLIALWPDAREERRLATRYEPAQAPARA
jgi:cytochrome c-type biogenesis protein CcmF